jgi:hypothetical protein
MFVLMAAMFAFGVSAHAETFKLNIQTVSSYNCDDSNWNGCTDEAENLGVIEIDLADGVWTKTITKDNVNFEFTVVIAKLNVGYGVVAITKTSSPDAALKSASSNAYTQVTTQDDLPLMATFTDSLEVNSKWHGSMLYVQSYTKAAHVPQIVRQSYR